MPTQEKKNVKKKPYFCPYCKALFADVHSYKTKEKLISYICSFCDETFDDTTYSEVKNATEYNIKGDFDKKNATHFIKRTVVDLKKNGFSHKEIQEITHFSRSMINNITKIHANADKSMPLEKFLSSELMIEKDDTEKNILKAIQYGCSYDFICKIFDVSRREVSKASNLYKERASNQEKKSTDVFKKCYTVLLEKENQVLIKEKK